MTDWLIVSLVSSTATAACYWVLQKKKERNLLDRIARLEVERYKFKHSAESAWNVAKAAQHHSDYMTARVRQLSEKLNSVRGGES